MSLVRLNRVSKVYPGGVTALRDADLTIERGDMVGVVGPSGRCPATAPRWAGRWRD